ncbi:MAG: DNA-directed DNA polymerase [Candidatus Baldrarchaeia archaeon]
MITREMILLDCDYIVDSSNRPVIRLIGKGTDGRTCTVYVEGFKPYFYVLAREGDERRVAERIAERFQGIVTGVSFERKFLPLGYQRSKREVLRVEVRVPTQVKEIRDKVRKMEGVIEVFEADIPFRYRYMIDNGIYGYSLLRVKGEVIKTSLGKTSMEMKAHEVRVVEDEVAPKVELKMMSFDIECLPSNDKLLPDPSKDPIIIISIAFYPSFDGKDTLVLVSRPVNAKIDNIECFNGEEEMLRRFLEIIDAYDPDLITGYNILNFDLPYLLRRLKEYNIPSKMGRVLDKGVQLKKGERETRILIPGRIVADVQELVKSEFHLKRYTLDHVAEKLINEKKVELDYKDIPKLWNGNSNEIKKLIEYARKDAILPLKILLEKRLLDKYLELSRVCGLLPQDVIYGGQSAKVESLLLRYGKKRDIILPCKPDDQEIERRRKEREKKELKGATVLEPKVGIYSGDDKILVLDFRSLYPSIIIAYNICFTTLLLEDGDSEVSHITAPTGAKFVSKEVREGLMPEILRELMEFRVKVKKMMKEEKDPERYRQLDARQLAIKIMMNSFYGYTGYLKARIYSLDVANAITGFGRQTIEFTKQKVEETYGYEVIYGDTDSIMVRIKTRNFDEAEEIGRKISIEISRLLPEPLLLEFEKIYKSFLILSKKRYAGLRVTRGDDGKWHEDVIDMKGIETVRREWCDLVSEVMETILDILLRENNVEKAVNYFRTVVKDLKEGKIPLEKLILTRSLSKLPKEYKAKQPHVVLAEKLRKRQGKMAPSVGERIAFVIVKGKGSIAERAEDPEYVMENGLEIDDEYYLEKQLLQPAERLFKPLGISKKELLNVNVGVTLQSFLETNGNSGVMSVRSSMEMIFDDNIQVVCERCNTTLDILKLKGRFCPKCFSQISEEAIYNAILRAILSGMRELISVKYSCEKCGRSYSRPTLTQRCMCGGRLVSEISIKESYEKIRKVKPAVSSMLTPEHREAIDEVLKLADLIVAPKSSSS